MKNKQTTIQFFSTGYCTGNNNHIHKDGQYKKLSFQSLFAFIEHPILGKLLFDTGYGQPFLNTTQRFPYNIYRWATPVYYNDENSCINQLALIGVFPTDINNVIISHFHGDHVGGLKNFKNNTVWCSKKGLQHIQSINKYLGVTKAYLKPLLPEDMIVKHPEEELVKTKIGLFEAWEWAEDIFFVDLPGHCRGQTGLFLKNTNRGDVFLIADATWSSKAFREKIYPSKIVSLFVDSYNELTDTIDKLNMFHHEHKDVTIIPTHCEEVFNSYVK